MCGIFGVVSSQQVQSSLIDGLSKLEYRGYDSAGLSILAANNKIKRVRCVGKVKNLKPLLVKSKSRGVCGIAHTRWATHGGVTDNNAHPHLSMDKDIAIVHNGIIENSSAIRKILENKGIDFKK